MVSSERSCQQKSVLRRLSLLGALTLISACVSGSVAGGPNGSGPSGNGPSGNGNSSQAGADGQNQGQSGNTGEQPPPGKAGGGSTTVVPPAALPTETACDSAMDSPGPRVLRRLTAKEFAASIVDLFGDKAVPVAPVFNDVRVLGFTVDSSTLLVKELNADQLMTNAEAVASWAVSASQLPRVTQLATCSAHDQNCAKLLVKNFGRKAFRTAIPDGDPRIAAYSALFMAETSFADGAASVISAMLQSPYFLYRSEIGETPVGNTVVLTPYEVASSLSYLLTGSAPDETLLKAADGVKSGDAAALAKMVDEQSKRLLEPSSPQAAGAQDAVMNFMSGWLGLDRLITNVKDASGNLSDQQRAEMAAETKRFILGIWGASANNTVGDLFSATTNNPHDSGILGQASILIGYARSNGSSPTQRGHLVRSRIMCQAVPPPPDNVDVKFTVHPELKTTREQYLAGHAAPDHQPCYGCHRAMDPIGVAFEHYDGFGNYRDTENGVTIDATGTIYSASATDGDVNINGLSGPGGLQGYLAKSDEVKNCVVRYWSYYAFGSAGWAQDKCTYDAIKREAAAQSYSLKGVLTGILRSKRFTTRVTDQ
ncbi:MAG TPA: DUF1588 domain-containing protein [Polyangiaceae bacterium]|nr:DUF1588 domain-containing protein [Polyangiaceae bacterium]